MLSLVSNSAARRVAASVRLTPTMPGRVCLESFGHVLTEDEHFLYDVSIYSTRSFFLECALSDFSKTSRQEILRDDGRRPTTTATRQQ